MTDSSTGDAGLDPRFDPRFDPAFQPGYDPRVHGHASEGPPGPRGDAAREPVRESVDRIGPPPVRAEADAARADGADAHETTDPAPAAETTTSPLAAETPSSIRRFDPYLMTLWIVSAAFVAAGLLVVRYIADRLDTLNATGGGGTFNYYLLQVYTIGAPLLILLGVSTATGTLFVLAARRR